MTLTRDIERIYKLAGPIPDIGGMVCFLGHHFFFFKKRTFCLLAPPKHIILTICNENVFQNSGH